MKSPIVVLVGLIVLVLLEQAQAQSRKPATSITTFDDPAFQKWAKDVSNLPAEQQVKEVAKKLVELNPGFDGKIKSIIKGGRVVELSCVVDNVTDISPVRALRELKALRCQGSDEGRGKLSDLSPLQGMRLRSLNCYFTKVSDLTSLHGMPMRFLNMGSTRIRDLSPLKGMSLEVLNCSQTLVSDLSPLKGMQLVNVICDGTKVSDLSPLAGMPLTFVYCWNTSVFDLSPLRTLPTLEGSINVQDTKATAAEVKALRKSLPKWQVIWDDVDFDKPKTPTAKKPDA